MDSMRVSEAPDSGSIPDEATKLIQVPHRRWAGLPAGLPTEGMAAGIPDEATFLSFSREREIFIS